MNILFLSLEFVLPADRGLRVRSFTQLRLLNAIDSVESIRFLSLGDVPVPESRLRELERLLPKVKAEKTVFQPFHMRRHPKSLPRLLRLRALHRVPYIVAKCDSAEMHQQVRQALKTGKYDVVYIGSLGMASYLKDVRDLAPRARVVLEQHNVEWEIFDRLAPTYKQPLRFAAHLEALATKRYEGKAMGAADAVIAISQADARTFREMAGREAIVVPPFIEPRGARVEKTSRPALAYMGQLAWQPNVHGLDWFCDRVWPLVREKVPDATLTIAGPGLRKGEDGALLVPEQWKKPGITTVGFLEDLEDLYKDTVGLVAPILGGSGVRMKLLEAMSAGMATVTTSDGAAGLDVADGREMLVADDPAGFADRVVELLGDAPLRARLREAGYGYLNAHHSLRSGRRLVEQALGISA
jgi:glycosyltransferase involved in cell wall biosynthesis